MRRLRRWLLIMGMAAGLVAATDVSAFAAPLNHSEPKLGNR